MHGSGQCRLEEADDVYLRYLACYDSIGDRLNQSEVVMLDCFAAHFERRLYSELLRLTVSYLDQMTATR